MGWRRCQACNSEKVKIADMPRCALQSVVDVLQILMEGGCKDWKSTLAYEDRVVYLAVVSVIMFGVVYTVSRKQPFVQL